jgi:hypothetical protein
MTNQQAMTDFSNPTGQEHPIHWATAWPGNMPAQHRELVTQDKYLDLVRGV